MTKKWVDWDNTPIAKQPHELSEPVKKGKGEQALVDQFAELVRKTINAPDPGPHMRQVKPEEEKAILKQLFPHLAADEEELQKKEKEWANTFNNFFNEVRKPVERQKPKGLAKSDWGSRGAINPNMTEEEKRAQMTEEEWRIHQIQVTPDSESGIE